MAMEEQPLVNIDLIIDKTVLNKVRLRLKDAVLPTEETDLFAKQKKKQSLRNNEYYDMQETFDKLYSKSSKNQVFEHLTQLIVSKNNILLAYRNIKGNKGSKTSGVDKLNIKSINETNADILVEKVQEMFENYRPQKVRRVEIPKEDGSGRTRPLGIPTISDRLIQQCILQVLEPICEAKFSDNSYGFRPNRSCENAIAKAMNCMQLKHLHYCVDIDIKGFFDNVNHGKLLKQMWALGIRDKSLICIISKILKSEIILPNGDVITSEKGTPQGGIISPLLSNIVLNELDKWVESQWATKELKEIKPQYNNRGVRHKAHDYRRMRDCTTLKEMHIVRYADDFKIFTKDYHSAKKIFEAVKLWLKDRLDLDISPEKSKITNLSKNFTVFLGFKLKVINRGKKQVVRGHISDKAKKKITQALLEQIKQIQHSKNRHKDIWLYNSKIMGYHNYYQIATCCNLDFMEIAFIVSRALKHRLTPKRTGTAKGYVKEKYGSSKQMRFVGGTAIIPIGFIQTKNALDKKTTVNSYTPQGRAEIHQNLSGINKSTLHYIMESVSNNERMEYHNNRIALYSGQNGKCFVTGELLEIGDFHCHHKKPYFLGKDDSYGNLILVTANIHTLIHSSKPETINHYINIIQPNKKQLAKINRLRKELSLFAL